MADSAIYILDGICIKAFDYLNIDGINVVIGNNL